MTPDSTTPGATNTHGSTPAPATSTTDRRRGPLDGVVVADLSRILAGPYCSMLLADMGATVIKVEGPGGDDTRTWVPPDKDGIATYYLSIGRNKRSVVLDFRDDDDRALAAELLRRADVAIENFKPGGLRRFGLDYETAAATNPGLIYLSISGFGTEEGAWLPGYDLIVQATSGLMSLTGDPDGPAYRAGISVFDVMAGLHGLIGVLAALHQRSETGRGQHVEVNLLSSAMSGLVNQTAAYTAAGVVPTRMGNAHPSLFPYETMPVADREMIITAGNDRQFRALCEVLGIPEVADDPRFGSNGDRTRNREELRPLLLTELAKWKADDLFVALNKAGVPCGPINTIGQGVEFAESLGLAPRVEIGAGDRAVTLVRNPIGFSDADVRYDLPPPELGEHSDEIKAWLRDGAAAPRPRVDV
jgi:crotonobetainyl-CoA:carnitine CoA-transferase CaiB-like acyl-CoA transferase